MVQRQGPPLRSLIYDKAIEADHVMRQEVADSHQGQERDRSDHRPDRFTQPKPDATIRTTLRREASIDYRRSRGAAPRPELGTPQSAHRTASRESGAGRP